jgi:biotin transport system substrate-specific component
MAILVAAGSAFIAVSAQGWLRVNLPFTPEPITGQTFAVLTVGGLLGARLGAATVLLYLAEGCYGLIYGSQSDGFKVFADGNFGWKIIEGPTGGYLVGFVFAALVVGYLTERGFDRNPLTATLAMAVGNVTVYVFGLVWLDHHFPGKAFEFGLYPFILGDTAKLLLAAAILPTGWGLLRQLPGYQNAFPALSGEVRARDYRLPLAWVYLPLAALVVVGALLPWGVPGGGHESGVNMEEGLIALGAALISIGLAAVALSKRVPWEILRVAQFGCGAVAGFAAFYQIAQILESRSETFALSPLGAGLVIAALASVALACASLLDRGEEQEKLAATAAAN